MDGTPLSLFTDFVIATKPHKVTPTTEVLNDTARNYYLLGDMLKGRGDEEVVQNGERIINMVRLAKKTGGGNYLPGATIQSRGMNLLTKLQYFWRFDMETFAYTKEQITLNGSGSQDNWVHLLKQWREATYQAIWDRFEEQLLAEPDVEMESEDTTTPYSILAFITDDGALPAGFTTLGGIAATDPGYTYWQNQVESYTAASLSTTIYPAFDKMWHKLNWEGPASKEEWFTSTNWRKFKILTDLNGVVAYLGRNREHNDRLVPMNDPGTFAANPTYNGIPLKRVNALDEKAWANAKYIWLDSRWIHPVYHSSVYMDEDDPIQDPRQRTTYSVGINTYWNLVCWSRRRQGIIIGA